MTTLPGDRATERAAMTDIQNAAPTIAVAIPAPEQDKVIANPPCRAPPRH